MISDKEKCWRMIISWMTQFIRVNKEYMPFLILAFSFQEVKYQVCSTNSDGKPFSFTLAYHTYLSVLDISDVRVEGLETMDYLDNLQNKEHFTEQGMLQSLNQKYLSTPTNKAGTTAENQKVREVEGENVENQNRVLTKIPAQQLTNFLTEF
ncbi:hypothetical protein RYX36_015034 [Vicia faba]